MCPSGARTQAGSVMTDAEVLEEIERDTIFYDQSSGGVTFSGGEPLMQPDFLIALLEGCRARRIHCAVDTTGLAPGGVVRRVVSLTDLFLFDVKLVDDEAHRRVTGVSNRQILANLCLLAELGARIIVRFPLIPGVNDDPDHIERLGRLVASLGLSRVDILPYHRAGSGKYAALGREYRLAETEPPTVQAQAEVARILTRCGLEIAAGGRP
jgi:pyruvate formate lyase activating enzyme